jgi:hypothetical protein
MIRPTNEENNPNFVFVRARRTITQSLNFVACKEPLTIFKTIKQPFVPSKCNDGKANERNVLKKD